VNVPVLVVPYSFSMIAHKLIQKPALPVTAIASEKSLLSLDETKLEPDPPAAHVSVTVAERPKRLNICHAFKQRDHHQIFLLRVLQQSPCVRRGRIVAIDAEARISLIPIETRQRS